MTKNIADLPDFAALKKLAAALWKQSSAYHGAAVMVGAGFSRSSASRGDVSQLLPLWHDLASALAKDLGAGSSSDPLRLAEEYHAYYGKQALYDLIKKEVNDSAWMPGGLHKSLLELPWSEVLTTNWDTLLERASMEVHKPVYNVVSRQDDLASARSPRIVKLHGTVNVTEDLVFTQEDYRRYPTQHAAYVNFARQVFIENELCLIGFSGDDPNFLQWAGWVRDQLVAHARRIYLVGALNLTAAKRKYLESLNIAPVDLEALVADYDDHNERHAEATRIFLQALKDLKPQPAWEWSPTALHRTTISEGELDRTAKNPDHAAALLEQKIPALEADRKSYPGWLVCPPRLRWEIRSQISDPYPSAKNIAALGPDSRAKLLYEMAWQHGITGEAIWAWLAQEFLTICNPEKPCVLTKRQQLEVALVLLKNTRWFDDAESQSIEQAVIAILEKNAKYWPELTDEIAFHRAIVARDCFNYLELEKYAGEISGRDPVWKLRKASLLAELGDFDTGAALIAESYRELLKQHRNERDSIYVLSRLAWAHWLMRGVEMFKPGKAFEEFPFGYYKEKECNPWDHIEHIEEKISKKLEKQNQQEIEPSFEPGHYRDNSDTVTFINELHPILLLDEIESSVGMPLRWGSVSFLVDSASRMARLEELDERHRLALAIRAANSDSDEVLKKILSRTRIACLPQDAVDKLLEQCIQAIEYWVSKWSEGMGDRWVNVVSRIRVFVEVLARISVRANPEQSKQVFRLAMSYGRQPVFHHFWLFDALSHLIDYSLKSIPNAQHQELLLEALSFPLSAEIGVREVKEWVNPVIKNPGSRGSSAALDRRIAEIIDGVAPSSVASAPALLRLLPLLESQFLTEGERSRLSENIWGGVPDGQSLPETGLLKHALFLLPSPNRQMTREIVRRFLFEVSGDGLFATLLLTAIANAAEANAIKEFPDANQASDYFNRLTAWRRKQQDNNHFGFSRGEEKNKGELIGEVLAHSVVPSLSKADLIEKNFEKLSSFYKEVGAAYILMAFPYFVVENSDFSERVEKILRTSMLDSDSDKVACSAYALLRWREAQGSPATARLISRLIYSIGSGRIAGLSAQLWTANEMYKRGYLSEVEIESLVEAVPLIFDNADYGSVSHVSREAVSISLLRAACVRLAKFILREGENKSHELLRILEDAKKDALPEVRFAEMAED